MESFDRRISGVSHNIERPSSPFGYQYEDWSGNDDVELTKKNNAGRETNAADHASVAVVNDSLSIGQIKPSNRGDTDVCTYSSSSGSGVPTVSRRRKKPKGFPKRPLSGYNIFFKEERVNVLQEFRSHRAPVISDDLQKLEGNESIDRSSVSFQDLGKIIGKRWKALSEEDRRRFEALADQDNVRYRSEMDEYNEVKRKRNEEKSQRVITEDIEDTKPLSSAWSTMVLSRPPDIHPQFHPLMRPAISSVTNIDVSVSNIDVSDHDWNDAEQTQVPTSSQQTFSYSIPPGTELVLPDQNGIERRYQVQYNFYKMTRADAEIYMNQLARTSTVTPYGFTDYPPPPPSAQQVQFPYW
jgi:hypothetical protein